eukprot:2896600-Rhodomonas_salina.1
MTTVSTAAVAASTCRACHNSTIISPIVTVQAGTTRAARTSAIVTPAGLAKVVATFLAASFRRPRVSIKRGLK